MPEQIRPLWVQIKELEEAGVQVPDLSLMLDSFIKIVTNYNEQLVVITTEKERLEMELGYMKTIFKVPLAHAVTAERVRLYGPLTELGKDIQARAILEQTHGTEEEQIQDIARFNNEMIKQLSSKESLTTEEKETLVHCKKWQSENH